MPSVVAPLEELAHLRGARPVAVGGGVVAELLRPAPVAVDDHRHVARQRGRVELAAESVLVEAVEEARDRGARSLVCTALRYPHRPPAHSGADRRGLRCQHDPQAPPDPPTREELSPRRPDDRRLAAAAQAPTLPNIPLLDDELDATPSRCKPTWRGWIHAGTFPVAIAAGVVLIVLAEGAAAKWAARSSWRRRCCCSATRRSTTASTGGRRTKVILKRIDHANIFLLIAGTYTPLAVLALPARPGLAAARDRLGRRPHRHRLPRVLDPRAALALRPALPAARLGRGHVPRRPPRRERGDDGARRSWAACCTRPARSSTA